MKIPKTLIDTPIVPLSIWLKDMNWTKQLQYLEEVVAFYNQPFNQEEYANLFLHMEGVKDLNGNYLIGKYQYKLQTQSIREKYMWDWDANVNELILLVPKTIDSFINHIYNKNLNLGKWRK